MGQLGQHIKETLTRTCPSCGRAHDFPPGTIGPDQLEHRTDPDTGHQLSTEPEFYTTPGEATSWR